MGRRTLVTHYCESNTVYVFSPWLLDGEHTLHIFWDNAVDYSAVRIKSIHLQELQGLDTDGNGRYDWIDSRLDHLCGVVVASSGSLISPACLEGRERFLGTLTIQPSVTPNPAPNDCWYANISLSSESSTPVVVSFENGAVTVTNHIQWQATRILNGDDLFVRKGDSLLLTSAPEGATNGSMLIAIDGVTNYVRSFDEPVPYLFDSNGTYVIRGEYDNGFIAISNGMQVHVSEAAFIDSPACWVGRTRSWSCTQFVDSIVVDCDERVEFGKTGIQNYSLCIDAPERRYAVARVCEGGPIADTCEIRGFKLYSSWETYVGVVEEYPDESQLVEMGLVMSPRLADLTVQFEIFIGGIVFYDDGSLLKNIPGSDFDDLGFHALQFVRSPGAPGSVCHHLRVFQGTDFVGQRE